jgi:hypothetical protein
MVYIGVDNGVSNCLGMAAITSEGAASIFPIPTKKQLSYTKVAKNITRIDHQGLKRSIQGLIDAFPGEQLVFALERPMVNGARFNASLSAIRCLESMLIALEEFSLPYSYIDSKEWQKVMLPSGIKGTKDLKEASKQIGQRLFPYIQIKGDADSLLIAEYVRRKNLGQNPKTT